MATTTNYGWTTPDDTALVKDGAAAIRTLGSSIDTTTKALNPSTTLGDIEYRSSTANTNTRLAIGSNGNVLGVSGGVPAWVAAPGGGKLLQVVSAAINSSVSNSTGTYADTGITATITPTLATSKVLILLTISAGKTNGNSGNRVGLNLMRGATELQYITQDGFFTNTTLAFQGTLPYNYLDSPNTTSATTYKVQIKNNAGAASVTAQPSGDYSSITLLEIGA